MTDTQFTEDETVLYGMRGHLSQRLRSLSQRALMMDAETIRAMNDTLDEFREDRRAARSDTSTASTDPTTPGESDEDELAKQKRWARQWETKAKVNHAKLKRIAAVLAESR